MPPTPPGLTLRGRDEESAVLATLVSRAEAGTRATAWIEGPPGIGKSRLLTAAAEAAGRQGFLVARAGGDELERLRPFGLIARALGCTSAATDPRRAEITSLLATHEVGEHGAITVSSDPGLQFRVVDAFADLVEELACATPVLLALDDLQWADTASLLVVNAIRRRGSGLPLALLGCFRPVADSTPLLRMLQPQDHEWLRHVVLGPLSDDDVADLVADTVDGAPGAGLLRQAAAAGGNPLFITELVSALAQDGALRHNDGCVEVDTVSSPATLRMTVLRRLSHLPTETLELLRSASILGAHFTLTDLAAVTGRSVGDLSTILSSAMAAGALEDDQTGLRFRHDLIHEAVYRDIPAGVRTSLHREAGGRLADVGAPARTVAEHLSRGAQPGDDTAIEWLVRAAREDASRFPETGAELFGRALDLMDPRSASFDQVWVERADTLMRAGNLTDTIAACRDLLERGHGDQAEAGALLRLASALIVTGHPDEARGHLDRLENHEAATDEQRAMALTESATANLWLGELARCADFARRAGRLAATVASEPAATGSLAALSVVAGLHADFSAAIDLSETALHGIEANRGRTADQYPVHATRGFLLIEMDRFDQARAELDLGRRRCEDGGVLWPVATYQAYLGVERFARGEWDDAVSELETSIGLIEETGVSFAAATVHTVMALIRLHRNDFVGTRLAIEAAAEALPQGPRYVQQRLVLARAMLAEAEGDDAAAHDLLREAWAECASAGTALDYPRLAPDLVRLSLARGMRGPAEEVAAALSDVDGVASVLSRRAAVARCRGLLEDDPGTLAEAAETYTRAGRPLEAALTSQQAAVAFARNGGGSRARALFDDAGRVFEQLRAHRDLLRLEAAMRETGMPRGRRGPRRRPTSGWDSLTSTERAVADLVAEGLTNPQIGARLFVSRRTVQTHVSHIFTKLDLSSRAQLAAMISRRSEGVH